MLDTEALAELIAELVGDAVALALPAAIEKATAPLLERIAELEVREIPTLPEMPALPELPDVAAMVAEALEALPKPEIKTVTVEDLAPIVTEAVAQAVAELPKPEDGKSIEPEAVRAMIVEIVDALPKAKDGVGLAGLVIDREGELIATLTDGTLKALGRVVGRDVDMREIERMVAELVAAIPRPRDGFSLEDFDTKQLDDGRTVRLTFSAGEHEYSHELHFPVMLYRGVWQEGEYKQGDVVTWGGSLWHAERDTTAKPDSPDGEWRLAVKKGRDAKAQATLGAAK